MILNFQWICCFWIPEHKTYVEVRRCLMVYMFPSYTFPEHKTYVEVRQSLTFYKYPLYKFLEHRKYNEVGRCLMCCTFPLLESPEHKTYVEVRQMHSNLSKYSNIWNLNRVSNRRPPCITTGKTRRPGVCHPLVDILFQFLNILNFLNLTWVLKTCVISNILNILNFLNLDIIGFPNAKRTLRWDDLYCSRRFLHISS